MSQSAQDIFRRKLEEARERRQSEGFPMEFAGFPCRVRPLARLDFIRAGRMPEYLTRMVIEFVDRVEKKTVTPDDLSAEQVVEGEQFKRRAVCAVLIEPRVVESGDVPPGGYLFADLDETAPEFVSAVFQWIMRDCPAPKEEKGEEVLGVEDLEKFPEGGERGTGAQLGGESESVGATAAYADAADGERLVGE